MGVNSAVITVAPPHVIDATLGFCRGARVFHQVLTNRRVPVALAVRVLCLPLQPTGWQVNHVHYAWLW